MSHIDLPRSVAEQIRKTNAGKRDSDEFRVTVCLQKDIQYVKMIYFLTGL